MCVTCDLMCSTGREWDKMPLSFDRWAQKHWGDGTPALLLTCIIKLIKHWGLSKVKFPKMHNFQFAAHDIARCFQALEGHALGRVGLSEFCVDNVGNSEGSAFAFPRGHQSTAIPCAGEDGRAQAHRSGGVLPESPGSGDDGASAGTTFIVRFQKPPAVVISFHWGDWRGYR